MGKNGSFATKVGYPVWPKYGHSITSKELATDKRCYLRYGKLSRFLCDRFRLIELDMDSAPFSDFFGLDLLSFVSYTS